MAVNNDHLEDINNREFYDFYRKNRRSVSKKIDQHKLFIKAINGFLIELKRAVEENEHGVHLRGLGVVYKKPFGQWFRRMSLFTHRRGERGLSYLYLEDEYLRNRYIIKKVARRLEAETDKKKSDKPDATMLHRKLIKKNT